ncbi:MAG: hypothetical protein CEN89_460 [Candidatus Berkelbacteria bacterium Licking1014_7]|uniref:Uncharacterized protein n=1 Tax=Candidatus Berkelbacteria bacterium Licking1014_7 TaxID=2017147 RepID=A0A554LIV1_9BACT|nr:MAG: hypothetical protein CEN89_460 [Candidatus Berkelbacteria bacterium Licking1014_7]
MSETKLIDATKEISRDEANELLRRISGAPVSLALVDLFVRASAPDTLRRSTSDERLVNEVCTLFSDALPEEVRVTVMLKQQRIANSDPNLAQEMGTTLSFYKGKITDLPVNPGSSELVTLYGGPQRMGVWMYGRGNAMTYDIVLRTPSLAGLFLLSPAGRWILEMLGHLAKTVSEFHLKQEEQLMFYQGDTEEPDH